MLKKVILKNKTIPVPVPVVSLSDAIEWIDGYLVGEGQLITKMSLDGVDIYDLDDANDYTDIKMTEDSQLEVIIDSPKDMVLQSLESVIDLAKCNLSNLKKLAVDCWQVDQKVEHLQVKYLIADLDLITELSMNLKNLLDRSHIDSAPVLALSGLMIRVTNALREANTQLEWKKLASILLTRIDPLLKEIIEEAEILQIKVHAVDEDKNLLDKMG